MGYPLTFAIVTLVKYLGTKYVKPWIMFVVTISNNSWLVYGSEISAEISTEIILLVSSVRMLINHIKMCAWGNPRICHSIEYIQQRVKPNKSNFVMKFIKGFNFGLNTCVVMPWRCIAFWPGSSEHVISCHFGLHVNLINKHGRPYSRTSILYLFLHLTRTPYIRWW